MIIINSLEKLKRSLVEKQEAIQSRYKHLILRLNFIQNLVNSINDEWFFYYVNQVITNKDNEYGDYNKILLEIFENVPLMSDDIDENEASIINLNDFKYALENAYKYQNDFDFHDPKKEWMDNYIQSLKSSLTLLASLYDQQIDVNLDELDETSHYISYITDDYNISSELTIEQIQDFINKYVDYFSFDELEQLYINAHEAKQASRTVKIIKETGEAPIDLVVEEQALEEPEDLSREDIVSAVSESLLISHEELIQDFFEEELEKKEVEKISLNNDEKVKLLAELIYKNIENNEEKSQKIEDYIQKIQIVQNIIEQFWSNYNNYNNLFNNDVLFKKINEFIKTVEDFKECMEILSNLKNEIEIENNLEFLIDSGLNSESFNYIIKSKNELDQHIKKTKSTKPTNENYQNIIVLLPGVFEDLVELCPTADLFDKFFKEFKSRIDFMRSHNYMEISKYYKAHGYKKTGNCVSFSFFPRNLYFGEDGVAQNYHQNADILRIVGSCDKHKEVNRDALFEHYGVDAKLKAIYSFHEFYDKKVYQKNVSTSSAKSTPIGVKGYSRYAQSYNQYYTLLQKETRWTTEEENKVFEFIDQSNELLQRLLEIESYNEFREFVDSYKSNTNNKENGGRI